SSQISNDIDSDFKTSLLKTGVTYNLDLIKAERERIDNAMKERGYYYFKSDYILVKVDSNLGNHKVNMYVKLKEDVPDDVYNVYKINNIYIYPNYKLRGNSSDTDKSGSILYKGYYINDKKKIF